MSFLSIYYDSYKNKLFLKEFVDGKVNSEILSPKFEYYVEDRMKKSEITDIYGTPVIKKISENRDGMKSITESGIKCYETDISMDVKFLHSRYEKQKIIPDVSNFQIAILDIEISSPNEFPKPSDAKYPINLISCWFSKTDKVYTFGTKEYTGNSDSVKNYCYCEKEKEMLNKFIDFFRRQNVNIISGWNIDTFDIPYLVKRCEKLEIERSISPYSNIIEKRTEELRYSIAGISILDYIDLYKKFTYSNQESYSLNFISKVELGEGKLDLEGTINDAYDKDWNKFVEYNVQDVLLVKKLDKKRRLIELIVNIAYQSLIPFEKVFSSLSIHVGYILKYLHLRNKVMPNKSSINKEEIPGAYVFAKEGMYKQVVSYDVESMYPHMIMQFNIGPETLIQNPSEDKIEKLIKTPVDGVYYRRDKKSILSEIVSDIFQNRKKDKVKQKLCSLIGKDNNEISKIMKISVDEINRLKNEIEDENGNEFYYGSEQQVKKILINSLYGALANEHFHFYNPINAKVITLGGQDLIKFLSDSINNYFKDYFWKNKKYFKESDMKNKIDKDIIVLTDTDSNYVSFSEVIDKLGLKFNSNKEFLDWFNSFDSEFFQPFLEKCLDLYAKKYGIEKLINFRREKVFEKMIVIAKKRYIISVIDDDGKFYEDPKFKITGVEIIRTDTPQFCRDKLLDTVKYIFKTENKDLVVSYMRDIKEKFKHTDISTIAFPTGISDYRSKSGDINEYVKKGIFYEKGLTIHNRAAINYNYIVAKYGLKLQQIDNGTKMRYIYINDMNSLHQNVIGFIGNWPEKFNELFKVDYDLQWEKSFQTVIQRLFDVLGWEEINFNNKLNKFFE